MPNILVTKSPLLVAQPAQVIPVVLVILLYCTTLDVIVVELWLHCLLLSAAWQLLHGEIT